MSELFGKFGSGIAAPSTAGESTSDFKIHQAKKVIRSQKKVREGTDGIDALDEIDESDRLNEGFSMMGFDE